MTTEEMLAEMAAHDVNYFVHYNCHSKRYIITVPWLDVEVSDKKVDVALRLVLLEMSEERHSKYLPRRMRHDTN